MSWTLIQVTSKNETRFFSSKGEGGGGRDAGIENLILSIKQLHVTTNSNVHAYPFFVSNHTQKKGGEITHFDRQLQRENFTFMSEKFGFNRRTAQHNVEIMTFNPHLRTSGGNAFMLARS